MRRLLLKLFRRRRLQRDLEAEIAFHREMAAAHGGSIQARNASPRGAVFTAALPTLH